MDWSTIHADAGGWARSHHPTSDTNHRKAFANAVTYLVTGASGGSHGPSLREHLVSWSLMGIGGKIGDFDGLTVLYPDGTLPRAGQWDYDDAIAFADPLCFDPPEKHLDRLIQISGQEHCFDDAAGDIAAVKKAARAKGGICKSPGCDRRLHKANKSGYCKRHRHKSPSQKEAVRRAKGKSV